MLNTEKLIRLIKIRVTSGTTLLNNPPFTASYPLSLLLEIKIIVVFKQTG